MASKVSFRKLWDGHIGDARIKGLFWENQCAARMSVTLQKAGISLVGYPGKKIPFKDHFLAARAQEIADWLDKTRVLGSSEVIRSGKASGRKDSEFVDLLFRTGIVFIKNGWGRTDHIDLWDSVYLKNGDKFYLRKGEEIRFWPIK